MCEELLRRETPRLMCKVSYGNKGRTEEPVRKRHLVRNFIMSWQDCNCADSTVRAEFFIPILFPSLALSDSYNIFFSVFTDSLTQALIHTNFIKQLTYIVPHSRHHSTYIH